MTIKGPKGIGSFLDLTLVTSKSMDIKAPIKKDSRMFKITFLRPRTKPKDAIRVTSPSPIPPCDRIYIIKNKPPESKSPNRLSKRFISIFSKRKRMIFCKVFNIKITSIKLSGITICNRSIKAIIIKTDEIRL